MELPTSTPNGMELSVLPSNAANGMGYYQKGIRFSDTEKEVFIEILEEHQHIINCPHHDGMTMVRKEQEWQRVTDEFNRRDGVFTRDVKQLKCLWKNLKARTKKFVMRDRHCNKYEALGIRRMPVNPELSRKVLDMIAFEMGTSTEELFDGDALMDEESSDAIYLDDTKVKTEPNGEESEENVAEKVIKTEPSEKAGIMEIHQYLSDTYLPNAGGKNGQDSDDGASSTEAETSEIMQQTKNTSKELNNPNELEIDSNDDNMDSALPQKRYIIRSLGKRKRRMSAPDESDFTRYPSLSMPPLGASSTSQDHAYKLAQEEYAGKLRIAAQDQTVDNEETKLKIITQKRLLQMAQREHEQKMKNLKLKEQILRLQRDKLLADKSTNLRFDDI